ncbi:MAG: efflux RND transporter periplasmic adaptor subunit [Chitinophagaceae bacterium]|nr:efflux RND transporter periplasmic adaptor subunit [Chitinophagaceae bacterium]MCW5927952.1 efflux RND transporter periplasmic adaptor subunit [Chitinophagaceae bacterium]
MLYKTIKATTVLGIWITLAACGAKQQDQRSNAPRAVPVTVTTVSLSDAVYHDEYPATVVALNQVELRPQVTGYITGIYFKDGDRVRKGQRLYTIDQQVYTANEQQAIANLQVQETNLVKAQRDADRYHELDKQDAIAKQQVDYADAALEAAKKQVEAAKAALNAVRSNVGFATITAPFDGTIGISQVRVGASVVAGQTILNTVSTDNPIGVDFVVDQNEIYRFVQLQQLAQSGKDSTFSIAFGREVYPSHGTINFIDRAVDVQTGTIKTRLVFPNDKNFLKPGMSGTVRVLNRNTGNAMIVPLKAVTEQLGSFFVYTVGDSNKVTQKKITIERQLGNRAVVKDGLTVDERIVVEGVQNLREGTVVSIAASGDSTQQAN